MDENKQKESDERIKKELKILFHKMRFVLVVFYYFRNNSRFTNRYYYRFISAIGAKNYHSSLTMKYEWESARHSFDRMYGLLAGWKDTADIISISSFEGEMKSLQNSVNELSAEIKKINGAELSENDYIEKIKSTEDSAVCGSVIKCYSEVKNMLDDINQNKDCSDLIQEIILQVNRSKQHLEIVRKNTDVKNT